MSITTFAGLLRDPLTAKVYLCEINPAIVQTGWTLVPAKTYTYSVAFTPGPVNKVRQENSFLTTRTTLSDVESNAGSYWWDEPNQTLYVHASDGADPDTHTLIVYFWMYFATKEKYFNDRFYRPLLRADSIPAFSAEVKPIYSGASVYSLAFANVSIINDRWYDTIADSYLWKNKNLRVLIGGEDLPYSEYSPVFSGLIREDRADDERVTFELNDGRVGLHTEIPLTTYNLTDYPNLQSGADGQPVPIAYGLITGIKPTCINTVSHIYKVAAHAIKAFNWVKKIGTTLTAGTDYTVDLSTAQFTLTAAPSSSDVITCEIEGKELSAGVLMDNASDINKDIFKSYLGLADDDLDLTEYSSSKTNRTYKIAIYINQRQNSSDIIRTLDQSVIGQTIVTNEGKIAFVVYTSSYDDASILKLYDEDYESDFQVTREVDPIYKKVRIKYYQEPVSRLWNYVEATTGAVQYKYDVQKTLSIETYLRLQSEATNAAEAIANLLQAPLKMIQTTVSNVRPYGLKPTDKVMISRKRGAAGAGKFEEAIYRVLRIDKQFSAGTGRILAIDDLQSLGDVLCNNCYNCQVCVVTQSSCSTCYTCQNCNTTQAGCQNCYSCQACNVSQGGCQSCDTAQAGCTLCYTCESCVTSQGGCSNCNTCQACVVAQGGCQNCDVCQVCVVSQNACASCYACQVCDVAQAGCQTCNTCQSCDTSQGGGCSVCNTCQSCNTTQSSCQTCNACQVCNTAESGCSVCNACQNCNSAQSGCAVCNACQNCISSQGGCSVCNACQSCNTAQAGCQTCNSCQNCNSNQGGCQTCNSCQNCNTNQGGCQTCNSCQNCNTNQGGCQTCNSCQNCNSNQGGCSVCNSCQSCNTNQGGCQTCNACQHCNGCQVCNANQGGCQLCNACETCNVCEGCFTSYV